jgi:hypothetical protein
MEVVLQDDSTVDLRESGSLLHRLFTKTQSGLELGQFNSVACLFDTATNQSEFETLTPQRWTFEQLLSKTQPDWF